MGGPVVGLCPCLGGEPAPGFVGDNYQCESGSTATAATEAWFTTDPLFDAFEGGAGAACAAEGAGTPAVVRHLGGMGLAEPLSVRLMRSGLDENVAITRLVIEVRE